MAGHWSQGLLHSMNDPNSLVISTDKLVVIKDKFPKAKLHFLVLPIENIPSIFDLNRSHLELLNEIDVLAQKCIEINGRKRDEFTIGYHASPSMQRLHLHVLTKDFDSPCLKTKVHWNSFNTAFFLSTDFVADQISLHGHVTKLSETLIKDYLSSELACHICNIKIRNMPKLKDHIRTHF